MDKAPDAFRTISEVADDLDVPQHVLRFWESRFTQIRPMKRAGGRRYYRADDVDLLRGIRQLLYGEGYTIRGVQRILKEQGVKFVQCVWQEGAAQPPRLPEDEMAEDLSAPPSNGDMERREPRFDDGDSDRAEPPVIPVQAKASGPALGREDVRKLQAVLHELGECRRLLDGALR